MTIQDREFAKNRIEYLLKISNFALDKHDKEALELAIKALSQEPTEKPMTTDEMEREYEKSKALFHKIVECDDAISRKWLLDGKRTVYITDRFDGRTSAYISKKTVEDAPSVTQKSGKWIDYSDEGYVECPFCGHATTCEDNIDELRYCFYCGARMESEDKE